MLGFVDFIGREDMFESMRNYITNTQPELKDFIILDEDGHTVWVIWSERSLI